MESLETRLLLAGDLPGAYGDRVALVEDFQIQADDARVRPGATLDDRLYFHVADGTGDVELWSTDGTEQGTSRIREFAANASVRFLCCPILAVEDRLYFLVDRVRQPYEPDQWYWYLGDSELWTSDGTEAGTEYLNDLGEFHAEGSLRTQMVAMGDRLLLAITGWSHSSASAQFWASEDQQPAEPYSRPFHINFQPPIRELVPLDGVGYFMGATYDAEPQFGLWSTDPETRETNLVHGFLGDEIGGGGPFGLTVAHGALYFTANAGEGYELWTSDGTAAGTRLVKDIVPGPEGSRPEAITPSDEGILFQVKDGRRPTLWYSDGSSQGTQELPPEDPRQSLRAVGVASVHSLWPGIHSGRLMDLTGLGVAQSYTPHAVATDELLLVWPSGSDNLWVKHLQTGQTNQIGRGYAVTGQVPQGVILSRGDSLVLLDPDSLEAEPFATLPKTTRDSDPSVLTGTDDALFFLTEHDGAIRRLDAAGTATVLVQKQLLYNTHEETRLHTQLQRVGDNLFVVGPDGLLRHELSSGSSEILLADEDPRTWRGSLFGITSSADLLYLFRVRTRAEPPVLEIWKSDGTVRGTQRLVDSIPAGRFYWETQSPAPQYVAGKLFFLAAESQLWVSDERGQAHSLELSDVASMTPHQGEVYLLRNTRRDAQVRELELWRSDGSPEGTVLVASLEPADGNATPSRLVSADDGVYFADGEGALWRWEDRTASLNLVKRFPSPPPHEHCCRPPVISQLVRSGDQLFFAVDDGQHGNELWVTDGTEEGTKLAVDLRPGDNASWPSELTVWNNRLFFAADDGIHGQELWSVDLTSPPRAGDIDANGVVDFQDFLVLAAHFGQSTDQGIAAGDLDQDGQVSFTDFLLLSVAVDA